MAFKRSGVRLPLAPPKLDTKSRESHKKKVTRKIYSPASPNPSWATAQQLKPSTSSTKCGSRPNAVQRQANLKIAPHSSAGISCSALPRRGMRAEARERSGERVERV